MKQVIQHLRSGELELLDVPCPQAAPGSLLIRTRASLISAGTERMLVEFGRASLLGKARQAPERVQEVLDKIKADGLLPTLEAVFSKLDQPLPLGYCNAGQVVEVGRGVHGFAVGDRVASNGHHAEMVNVPVNLCAKIPDSLVDDQAAFAVLGSIALQGIRLLQPQLGETVTVYGLGLVGLLTVQMLVANGVKTLGVDLNPQRLKLAEHFGAVPIDVPGGTDPVDAALAQTGGHGVDGVLITAAAKNDNIVSQSARMSRKRGRIVLVGTANLDLNRAEFYEKELTFQVSCSCGPGRYDETYEQRGQDYPYAFVRWTEQRNIQAVLDLMEAGRLDVSPLITRRVPHSEAGVAYDLLAEDRSQLAIVLEYPSEAPRTQRVVPTAVSSPRAATGRAVVGMIGAGNFATRVLLPALAKTDAQRAMIASRGGMSAAQAARKFAFAESTTDYGEILRRDDINTVFIATRHAQHARMVVEALEAGKHVFVEKPLATTLEQLDAVRQAYQRASDRQVCVGFNRRFAPHVETMCRLVRGRTGPLCATMTVNAGFFPPDHWIHDPESGGGRIIGEGCHFIDLLSFVAGSPIVNVRAVAAGGDPQQPRDRVIVTLTMADGSIGTVQYLANGHRRFPRERLTVFADGRVAELDNFRVLRGYGFANFKRQKLWRQDKGHREELRRFIEAVSTGGDPLMPLEQLDNVSQATIAADRSARDGTVIELPLSVSDQRPRSDQPAVAEQAGVG